MRRITKVFLLLFFIGVCFASKGVDAKASTSLQNVSVTIPTDLEIVFEEDGSTSISEFSLLNNSLVPIEIQNIVMTEYNGWKLVQEEYEILVDRKEISLQLEGTTLQAGDNAVKIPVSYEGEHTFQVKTKRGAWTKYTAAEKALDVEFLYEIGTREFTLSLNGNGGVANAQVVAENGAQVSLPAPTRAGYEFAGWEDANGEVYTDTFTMPIGDTTLTAIWKEIIAYAIYSADDKSFRFVQSADVIKAGDTYGERKVTSVYTGFDKKEYAKEGDVPWYADGTNLKVTKVYVEDEINPISMQLWFYEFENCSYFDVTKVNTSNVTSLSESFRYAGYEVTGKFQIVGLNNWNVSKVTDFSYMFDGAAIYATSFNIGNLGDWNVSKATTLTRMFSSSGMRASTYRIGDLSGWNTANVVYMGVMFKNAGEKATWSLNCSKWNVKKVKIYDMFNSGVEDKVTAPKWVS